MMGTWLLVLRRRYQRKISRIQANQPTLIDTANTTTTLIPTTTSVNIIPPPSMCKFFYTTFLF